MENKLARKVVNRFFSDYYVSIAIIFIALFFMAFSIYYFLLLSFIDPLVNSFKYISIIILCFVFVLIIIFLFYLKAIKLFFIVRKELKENLIFSKEITVTHISREYFYNATTYRGNWQYDMYKKDKVIGSVKYSIYENKESFLYSSKSNIGYYDEIQSLDQFAIGEIYKITYLLNSKIIIDVEKII